MIEILTHVALQYIALTLNTLTFEHQCLFLFLSIHLSVQVSI